METIINRLLPLASAAPWITGTECLPCSSKVRSWLLDQDSLTQKLQASAQSLQVKVRQQVILTDSEDSLSSHFASEKKVLVREVFLCCDDLPVVFAQTEIPFSTLTEQQAQLADIGTRSLGSILFKDPSMRRDQIEVAQFPLHSAVHQLCENLNQDSGFPLWGRRSLFYVNNKPLLVSEVFLPASGIYLT